MCWKEEWAYAIRDLNKVISHIEKARKKIEERRVRAQRWYQNLSRDKKHGTPKELAKVQEIINGRIAGERECGNINYSLRTLQGYLRVLIESYGFDRKPGGSARVRKILEQTFKEAES